MATEDSGSGTAAYVPWQTFMNTLDALAVNMPNRIDRSAFPGQSGAGQSQLLIAFRFLGLINDENRPTNTLLALAVADEAARKVALRKVVDDKYADLLALNLMKTTPAEFAEQMRIGSRFNCCAVIFCRLPNSAFDEVSLPVSATPSHPRNAAKNG